MLQRNWYIAIVANNTERVAAERLGQGYEVYLPAQKVVSVWKDGRRKVREKILIPGKIFVRCTERERMETMALGLVKRYMVDIASSSNEHGHRNVATIPDDQVERLRFVLGQSEAAVTIDNGSLRPGEPVRVIRGPFLGLEGTVADWTSDKPKVQLKINHLGCASVEVNITDIKRM